MVVSITENDLGHQYVMVNMVKQLHKMNKNYTNGLAIIDSVLPVMQHVY